MLFGFVLNIFCIWVAADLGKVRERDKWRAGVALFEEVTKGLNSAKCQIHPRLCEQ